MQFQEVSTDFRVWHELGESLCPNGGTKRKKMKQKKKKKEYFGQIMRRIRLENFVATGMINGIRDRVKHRETIPESLSLQHRNNKLAYKMIHSVGNFKMQRSTIANTS